MNDKEKALAIGAAIVVIVALIFLWPKARQIVQGSTGNSPQPVAGSIGGITINRAPFVLPSLDMGQPWERLSAIGACCSDCSGSAPRQSYERASGGGITFITNEGNRGSNVFNYIQAAPAPAPRRAIYAWSRAG